MEAYRRKGKDSMKKIKLRAFISWKKVGLASAALGLAMVLSILFTWLIFHGQVSVEQGAEQVLSLQPLEEQNPEAWGRELRFYSVTVNGEALDLQELAGAPGWSYEEPFLFYSGQGEAIRVSRDEPVTTIELSYCSQDGSGKVEVLYNGQLLGQVDMYDANWVQKGWEYRLTDRGLLGRNVLSLLLFWFPVMLYALLCFKKKDNAEKIKKTGLGAFDLAKGVGITLVVTGHVLGYFGFDSENGILAQNAGVWLNLMEIGLMPMFFFISGYGFKPKKTRECIRSQAKLLLLPYAKVALFCCALSVPISLIQGQNVLERMKSMGLGFLLCSFQGTWLGSTFVEGNNPVWFLWALAFASILLNFILKIRKKTGRLAVMAALLIVYGAAMEYIGSGWAVFEVLFAVAAMYAGMLLKQSHFLEQTNRRKGLALAAAGLVVCVYCLSWQYPAVYVGFYIVGRMAAAMLLLCVCYGLNRFENRFLDMLRTVGRYTYWILCIHTVELACLPFYLIAQNMPGSRLLAGVIIWVSMVALIVLGCVVIKKVSTLLFRRKKKNAAG